MPLHQLSGITHQAIPDIAIGIEGIQNGKGSHALLRCIDNDLEVFTALPQKMIDAGSLLETPTRLICPVRMHQYIPHLQHKCVAWLYVRCLQFVRQQFGGQRFLQHLLVIVQRAPHSLQILLWHGQRTQLILDGATKGILFGLPHFVNGPHDAAGECGQKDFQAGTLLCDLLRLLFSHKGFHDFLGYACIGAGRFVHDLCSQRWRFPTVFRLQLGH